MKAKVRRMDEDKVVIDFYTNKGVRTLEVLVTSYGCKYEDFSEWDISDYEYYKIEEIVENVTNLWMSDNEIDYNFD